MTTQISRHHLDPRFAIRPIMTTVAVVVALAAAFAFITLPQSGRAHSAAPGSAAGGYAPLIHFYGTGARPVARHSQPATSAQASSSDLPSQHFYGLQP
jgi:hypothetical protein